MIFRAIVGFAFINLSFFLVSRAVDFAVQGVSPLFGWCCIFGVLSALAGVITLGHALIELNSR